MARPTRVLVPIRYPITGQSAQTLAHAQAFARAHSRNGGAEILVLHVNLIQNSRKAREREIRRAVQSILDGVPFTVITRQGLLLEETILDEARTSGADVVIVGANQASRWRQLLSRILPTQPDIVSYLRNHIGPDVSVEVVA